MSRLRPLTLRQWSLRITVGLVMAVALVVWLGYEFPGWFVGRKSSLELLADVFQAPGEKRWLSRARAREQLKQFVEGFVDLVSRQTPRGESHNG